MKRKAVTQQMIADEVGVTLQTVSKALLGKGGMSTDTRQCIFATARRLGYRTRQQIDSLMIEHILPMSAQPLRFKLAYSGQMNNYKAHLRRGLLTRFGELGHTIEELPLPAQIPPSPQAMELYMREHDVEHTDGLFIAPHLRPSDWVKALLKWPLPKILLSYPTPGTAVDSVVWDVCEAIWQTVALLHDAGHRRLLYLGDIHAQPGYMLRWQAYIAACEQFGLRWQDSEPLTLPAVDNDWRASLCAVLCERSHDALIVGVDEQFADVERLLKQNGTQVPDDLELVAFINDPPDEPLSCRWPKLPIEMTGYRAADRMLWRLANPHLPYEHIRIGGRFYEI